MTRMFARPVNSVLTLLFLSAIPLIMAAIRLYQIPAGALPLDAAKYLVVPVAHFSHALAGLLFALLGPLQFAGVLKRRFGAWHRACGRVFVVAGLLLALSGLRLLWQFPYSSTWILDLARLLAAAGLAAALVLAVAAIRSGKVQRHRAWMIRAYAVGMGQSTVSFIGLPIYLITGEPPVGTLMDLLIAGSWLLNIAIGEWVIRRTVAPAAHPVPAG